MRWLKPVAGQCVRRADRWRAPSLLKAERRPARERKRQRVLSWHTTKPTPTGSRAIVSPYRAVERYSWPLKIGGFPCEIVVLFGAVMVTPASAQMCGGDQQAQASTPAQGGGMCGMGQAAADDPMADKPAQKPQAGGMCACCGKMAMMKGGMMGGGGAMQHPNMPRMEAPKQ